MQNCKWYTLMPSMVGSAERHGVRDICDVIFFYHTGRMRYRHMGFQPVHLSQVERT